jgi:hypothetical protein
MGKMNKQWHAKNRMPKNPTRDQRIEWHLEHSRNCSCRDTPREIALEIKKRKVARSIIGVVTDAPQNLSTHPSYFRGFGKNK